MQQTLAILKPDAVRQRVVGEVIRRLEAAGFRIVALKMAHLTAGKAGVFYEVHKERPFYKSLTQFMSSGPIVPMVLEADNAIERLRTLMGATDPSKAAEGTIRRDLASNVEQNIIHGSDGEATASTEIPFFFSKSELIS
jgi:nucleoside-diphosphate kinase